MICNIIIDTVVHDIEKAIQLLGSGIVPVIERAKSKNQKTICYNGQRYKLKYNHDYKYVHYSDVLVCKYLHHKVIRSMSLNYFKQNYAYEELYNEL
jgi:hypothetical protein